MCHVEAHMPMNIYCNFHAFIQIISDNMVKIKHYNGKITLFTIIWAIWS